MWFILALLVETFSFDTVDCTRWNIERTVAKTLKLVVSTDTPATLKHSTDSGRGNQLRISTNHLIDFILTELGQACTVTSTAIRRFVGQNRPKQGCHPLTLLVIALTAAPPSHHLRILTINVEFFSNCEKTVEFNAPFVKRLLSALPSDAPSDCLLIITLPKFLTSLASFSSLWSSLSACLSDSTSPSRNALSLLTTIEAGKPEKHVLNVQSKDGPTITRSFCRTCTSTHIPSTSPCLAVMRKAQPETDLRKARRSRLRRGCWRSSSGILSTRSHKALTRPHSQMGRHWHLMSAEMEKPMRPLEEKRMWCRFWMCCMCSESSFYHNGNDDRSSRYLTSFRKKGYLYIDLEVGYHQELYHVPFVAV
ncbi:hypothetical protein BLNAU_24781 [Blattamonas nauphoetae]|uniref:Uncharacterized protein n=1 Tax=Blattamonas nauphoetae TaxID=2049346 RepID=A0ABQ9WLW1_9EUKA|nr:hypothetical protein BLNAU_24781 [Blattamonas nauphoetae]